MWKQLLKSNLYKFTFNRGRGRGGAQRRGRGAAEEESAEKDTTEETAEEGMATNSILEYFGACSHA